MKCNCCGKAEATISLTEKCSSYIAHMADLCHECGSIVFEPYHLEAEIDALRVRLSKTQGSKG